MNTARAHARQPREFRLEKPRKSGSVATGQRRASTVRSGIAYASGSSQPAFTLALPAYQKNEC